MFGKGLLGVQRCMGPLKMNGTMEDEFTMKHQQHNPHDKNYAFASLLVEQQAALLDSAFANNRLVACALLTFCSHHFFLTLTSLCFSTRAFSVSPQNTQQLSSPCGPLYLLS